MVIPPKPTPPDGAPLEMAIPAVGADGQRATVNSGISNMQSVWNLRSGYNVAALNCTEAKYNPILEGYRRFLKVYSKSLAQANKEIDVSFRTQHSGREAIKARETYQTAVYNFFSLPPAGDAFCNAAMDLSVDLEAVTPEQFEAWSPVGLAKLEKPFKDFFDAYDKYRHDLAAWESSYGGGLVTVRPSMGQEVGTTPETDSDQ